MLERDFSPPSFGGLVGRLGKSRRLAESLACACFTDLFVECASVRSVGWTRYKDGGGVLLSSVCVCVCVSGTEDEGRCLLGLCFRRGFGGAVEAGGGGGASMIFAAN